MKRLVVVFSDELDPETVYMLFDDLQETSIQEVIQFDDGNKLVVDVPDEIPDPNYLATLETYWKNVIEESLNPCCKAETDYQVHVHAVYTLKKFLEKDQRLNPNIPGGNYGGELSHLL